MHFIYHIKVGQTNLNGGESFSCCFYSHLDISRTKWHFIRKMSELVVRVRVSFNEIVFITFVNLSLCFLCSRWDDIKLSLSLDWSFWQKWLKPGGELLISDYCKGPQELSDVMKAYIAKRQYYLLSPEEYGKVQLALLSFGFILYFVSKSVAVNDK